MTRACWCSPRAVLLVLASATCAAEPASRAPVAASVGTTSSPAPASARAPVARPTSSSSSAPSSPPPLLPVVKRLAPVAACVAPSLMDHGPRDRTDAVPDCKSLGPIVGGTDPRACGAVRPLGGLARIEEAAPIIDGATAARIAEIAARGRTAGRNARAFGLVGDSITEGLLFLGPFAAGSTQPIALDDRVAALLTTTLDGRPASIVDVYRGVPVEKLAGFSRDSFRATRAAKVGAPSGWALAAGDGGRSPLAAMIERVNPAVAIVMYGSNDAAAGLVPIDQLTSRFEANLRRIVHELDTAGIVPILSTIPRRGPQADLRDCAPDGLSDARVMVQTNAVSGVASRVACEERLPLIDLRHAFDGLVSAGLFSDGIHPTSHPRGSGLLDEAGLGCGYNVRNYLALRALREVREALNDD
jgi:hypothetical protein